MAMSSTARHESPCFARIASFSFTSNVTSRPRLELRQDAHWTQTGRRGSRDAMAIQVDEWTDQMLADVAWAKENIQFSCKSG